MRVLLDTHSLVWALTKPDHLSARARSVLTDSEFVASVANLWELLLKRGRKTALVEEPLIWWEEVVDANQISTLGIQLRHVRAMGRLQEVHGDPFDRILVAQAMAEGMALVSKDRQLARCGVEVIW